MVTGHLIIECADFNDVRRRFHQVASLQDLLSPPMQMSFWKI